MPVPAAADVVGETRSAPIIKQVVAQVLRLPEVDGQKGDSGQDTLVVRVITECGLVVRARPAGLAGSLVSSRLALRPTHSALLLRVGL
jgi:hypothetical protein